MAKADRKTITSKAKKRAKIDPSILALEQHRKADQVFFACARVADERRGDQKAERKMNLASDAADNLAWELAKTEPTTIAGASAVLNYIVDGPSVGLFDLGETAWHETAFKTVARALSRIARKRREAA